jgi:hypothetical protein
MISGAAVAYPNIVPITAAPQRDSRLYVVVKRMTRRSLIAANDSPSAEAQGANVAHGLIEPVLWNSHAGYRRSAPVPLGLPYPRHPNEMRLQSRIRNVARQLHAV